VMRRSSLPREKTWGENFTSVENRADICVKAEGKRKGPRAKCRGGESYTSMSLLEGEDKRKSHIRARLDRRKTKQLRGGIRIDLWGALITKREEVGRVNRGSSARLTYRIKVKKHKKRLRKKMGGQADNRNQDGERGRFRNSFSPIGKKLGSTGSKTVSRSVRCRKETSLKKYC